MAISFVRAVPRSSKRFATSAHAISKTNPVIPSSVSDKHLRDLGGRLVRLDGLDGDFCLQAGRVTVTCSGH